MNNKSVTYTKKMTYGGILTALSVVFIFLASISPTGKIALYALASMTILIMIVEFGPFDGLITYIATTVISFLIIPIKLAVFPYAVFFGYYGIIKYYIEKIDNIFIEWLIKLVFFNVVLYLLYSISKIILFSDIYMGNNIFILIIILEFAFIVYDYAYSIVAGFYNYRIRTKLFK